MNKGRAWKYGDNINTDIIAPPESMELDIKEASAYAMSNLDPEFAKGFREGDYFVTEHNLGSGSSRETAPLVLRELGVRVLVAKDYARIFYRNCINVGMIPVECPETEKIHMGDEITVDYQNGVITNHTTGETYSCNRMPEHITKIMECGGLIPYLVKERIGK
ncbi:MAG: 3-isopropylmalate dehydratase [Lachnospiraceae bacterium]|nr:3-isopropylmalate dehydratase [Lachnospiraceae bacterium]